MHLNIFSIIFSILMLVSCSNSPIGSENGIINKDIPAPPTFDYLLESPSLTDQQIFCHETKSCLKGQCMTRTDGIKACQEVAKYGSFCSIEHPCSLKSACRNRGDGVAVCFYLGKGKVGDFCLEDSHCYSKKCSLEIEHFKFCTL